MDAIATRDQIWAILGHQSRTMQWLADRIDYSVSYIKQIKYGRCEAPAEFRRRCSLALDLPLGVLFGEIDGEEESGIENRTIKSA